MESFVVRVWVPGDGPVTPVLRGVVQHVSSGRSVVFGATDQLLAFLRTCVADAAATGEGDPDA
ncbi:MAG TPA: hypothetical protein VF519_02365 [Mycobacteriales bacterium]